MKTKTLALEDSGTNAILIHLFKRVVGLYLKHEVLIIRTVLAALLTYLLVS